MAASKSDWDQRTLCSDGNCIGIIGADGRCKVCGLPYNPQAASTGEVSDWADDGMDDGSDAPPKDRAEAPPEPRTAAADEYLDDEAQVTTPSDDDSWDQRTLCIDESCIGVVGADGRCKECGRPHPQ